MKVGLLTSWPLSSLVGSGVVTSILGFARGLEAVGHEVRVVDPVGPRRSATGTLLRRIRYNGRLPRPLRRAWRRGHLETLVGFDWDGCYLQAGERPPLTVFCGGTLADILRFERGWPLRLLRLQARLERQNLRQADRVAVPSRYAAEAVRRCYGSDLDPVVVPLAVDAPGWAAVPSRPTPEDLSPPVVLTVARLYRRKGIDLLLQAWDRVRRRTGSGTLVVVGSGPEGGQLKRLASELRAAPHIRFTGGVADRSTLKGWYEAADLFCLPSRHETFGLVYLEAALHGLPAVGLETTAVPETVQHGVTGVLVAAGEGGAVVSDLARAIEGLLADDGLRLTLGREAARRAAGRSWAEAAAGLAGSFTSPG